MQSTSIRIRKTTRNHLERLKQYPRESFDDVISRLIEASVDDEPLSEETLEAIEQSLKEYREGIYYTHEEILADLGMAEEPENAGTSRQSGKSEKDYR